MDEKILIQVIVAFEQFEEYDLQGPAIDSQFKCSIKGTQVVVISIQVNVYAIDFIVKSLHSIVGNGFSLTGPVLKLKVIAFSVNDGMVIDVAFIDGMLTQSVQAAVLMNPVPKTLKNFTDVSRVRTVINQTEGSLSQNPFLIWDNKFVHE
jgi:hypothetical protein